MIKKYTNKVWAITDLIKVIGAYKKDFEQITDIERLNNNKNFQHLIYHMFYSKSDSGIIVYNYNNDNRMWVKVCFCTKGNVILTFRVYEKYKRIPYYFDIFVFETIEKPLIIQKQLAENILNDPIIFEFFK